jgi:PTS system N-acetylgalactosamine-specific IIA component
MKRNIIIITGHGEYAQGVSSFIKEVAGKLKNIHYVNFIPTKGVEQLELEYLNIIKTYEDKGIIFACDIVGGTPFNKAVEIKYKSTNKNIFVVSGANLAAILECCLELQDNSAEELAKMMVVNTKDTVMLFEEMKIIIEEGNIIGGIDEDGI